MEIEHLAYIAEFMREGDAREAYYATGLDHWHALQLSWQVTDGPRQIFFTPAGDPAAAAGVCEEGNSVGRIWMLGASNIDKFKLTFCRQSRKFVNDAREIYDYLYNYVDDDYEQAKRWLVWLGFEMNDPEPQGPFGCMFRKFEWERH